MFSLRTGVPGREVEVAPIAAVLFRRGRVPRVMWIRERHPHEPVGVVRERVEVGDRAVGDPVGVIPVARDRVETRLGCAGLAAGLGARATARTPWPPPCRACRRASGRSAATHACRRSARAPPARRARTRGTDPRARARTCSSPATAAACRSRARSGPCRAARCGSRPCRAGTRRRWARPRATARRWRPRRVCVRIGRSASSSRAGMHTVFWLYARL